MPDSQEIIQQANAIVREERERMRQLLKSCSSKSPSYNEPPPLLQKAKYQSVDDSNAARLSFERFQEAIKASLNRPLVKSPRSPALSSVNPGDADPKALQLSKSDTPSLSSLLDCTCRFLGQSCWVCGNTARLGSHIADRPVDIRRALREVEWRRRVDLPPDSTFDRESALKFWRRALEAKVATRTIRSQEPSLLC